ncbi:hypothetical protein B5X24_HaOG212801 [Helicoverpa armigera]|nr:hypothetical protein B5X24_HaOG212801 [Helicoverpa armigera]
MGHLSLKQFSNQTSRSRFSCLQTDQLKNIYFPFYLLQIGTTNMVHLRPEDFVDSDMSFGDKSVLSNIREIRRRLNENPEDPDLPELAPVPTPVHPTKPTDEELSRDKRSVISDSSADSIDEYAAPRVMAKTDDR